MKKFVAVLALLAIVAGAASAYTLDLPTSLYNGKLYDRSNIYSNSTPEGIGSAVDVGDEQRNVFTIDLLEWQGVKLDVGGPGDITAGPAFPGWPGSGALTGLLYDVNFRATESGAPAYLGASDALYFEKGTRYVAGTDWIDTYQKGGVDAAGVTGAGGLLFVYLDTANPIVATGLDAIAPASWTEKNVATSDAAIPGGLMDGLPGISDQEPWLILALMPNPLIAGVNAQSTDLIQETFFVFPGGQFLGFGTAFANVIGGTALQGFDFQTNLFGEGLDVKLNFSVSNPSVGSAWQLNSADPVMFGTTVIPEPATLSLIGLGLAGLGAWRRRRNAK